MFLRRVQVVKMSGKKFSIIFLGTVIGLLGICILWVMLIDPFGYYHRPLFGLQNIDFNKQYQNAGYIRHWDYETAIVGTSMTEQMRASEVDEIFDTKTIKLCASGAYSLDIATLLNSVCEEGKAKRIILGFDANYFRKPSDEYLFEETLYLYNKNVFDDVRYLLNKKIIIYNSLNMLVKNYRKEYMDMDDYYINPEDNYSKEIVLGRYENGRPGKGGSKPDYSQVEANINNIVPIIRDNSSIEFYIFIPPYSIMFWNSYYERESLDDELAMHQKMIESVIGYENVKIYYFMDNEEIITDLDNYMDSGHYSPKVCSKLIKMMAEGEHLLTKDNYKSVLKRMKNFTKSYDYDRIYEN